LLELQKIAVHTRSDGIYSTSIAEDSKWAKDEKVSVILFYE
jgi:hypothetical protein